MNTIEIELEKAICKALELPLGEASEYVSQSCLSIVEKYAVGFNLFMNDYHFYAKENDIAYYVKLSDLRFERSTGIFDYDMPKYNHSQLFKLYIQSLEK